MIAKNLPEFLVNAFTHQGDAKKGWTVKDVTDPGARLVIKFLNPNFHPEKPKLVTAKWASIFLGLMAGNI